MDCSPPGSSVRGIIQARILEWAAILFSRGSSRPGGWIWISRVADQDLCPNLYYLLPSYFGFRFSLYCSLRWKITLLIRTLSLFLLFNVNIYSCIFHSEHFFTVSCVMAVMFLLKSVSCSVVSDSCNPMDCSPPGSSIHGILQARILEWAAIPFTRGSS